MILIVAGTLQQAHHYAKEWGLSVKDWYYASCVESLGGIIPKEIRYGGTYSLREDWSDFQQELYIVEDRMKRAARRSK